MKYIKLYEKYSRYDKTLNVINNINIGDVISSDTVYMYVEYLNNNSKIHDHEECFIDGDLGDRIEEYDNYIYKEVKISDIDLDEWSLYIDAVDEYEKEYIKNEKYPPIVLDSDYSIIDGIHRANAVSNSGDNTIMTFVGINN